MYASITNFIAQNEMHMDMWIEYFKSSTSEWMSNSSSPNFPFAKIDLSLQDKDTSEGILIGFKKEVLVLR